MRCYAKALILEGHQVSVVSTRNAVQLPGKRYLYSGAQEDVNFTLLRNGPSNSGRLSRYLWAYLSPIALLTYTVATLRRSDVFILYFNTAWTRFAMITVLRLFGKKVVLELNEYPYSAEGSRLTRLPFVRPLLRQFVFRAIFPIAPNFIVISKALEHLVATRAPKAATLQVPILAEDRPVQVPWPDIDKNDIYIFHAGTLSEQKDGIYAVFKAFTRAHHELFERHSVRLKFLLTNNMTQPELWARINELLVRNNVEDYVAVTGFCSDDELDQYLRGALALIVNKPKNLQNDHNFPTKLTKYLASGRPVILAAEKTEANRFLDDKVNAITVAPNDSTAISEALVHCFENPAAAREIGQAGSAVCEERFFYARHAQRLSEFMHSL